MPHYIYHCPQCNKTFDIIHSVNEVEKPRYHSHHKGGKHIAVQMERVFLPTDIIFKGPGFYKTDNPKGEE